MRNRIRIDHPARSRGKLPRIFAHSAWKRAFSFRKLWKADHEVVIRRALDRRNRRAQPHSTPQPLRCPAHRIIRRGSNLLRRKFLHHRRKGITNDPVSRSRGMNIVEEAQNPCPVGRPRWKCIGMQQIVSLSQREIASLLFLRAKAGIIQPPLRPIGRKEPGQKLDDTREYARMMDCRRATAAASAVFVSTPLSLSIFGL